MQPRITLKIIVLATAGLTQVAMAQGIVASLVQAGLGVTAAGLPAKPGAALPEGAQVITPAAATAQLQFIDGGVALLAADSKLTITEYRYNRDNPQQDRAGLLLSNGNLRLITGAIPKLAPGNFTVVTPYGTFSPKGTDFTVSVCDSSCAAQALTKEGSYLHVDAGDVGVKGATGSATVPAGGNAAAYRSGSVEMLNRVPDGIGSAVPEPIIAKPGMSTQGPANSPPSAPRTQPPADREQTVVSPS